MVDVMIPVLFAPNAAAFTSNGIGALSDAVSCVVTEERNGAYELEMVYPLDGEHYGDIVAGSVIRAFCGAARQHQPFRVYKISRPINGRVSVFAQHVSYQLSMIPAAPFTASSASAALSGLASHAAESCPFSFWTDVTTAGTYTQTAPESIRSRLGGVRGSVLDVYGGEFEFDGYTVRLWAQRGTDRHVVIRYGKNLTNLKQEESIANTVTGVYPFYLSEVAYVELPEKTISAPSAAGYPYPRTVPLDLSNEFESTPTVEQLRTAAQNYISRAGIGVPAVSLSVSFANLADTVEYADVSALEQVELCDVIGVRYERLGVDATAKVTKTTWDVLAGRYKSIEVGDARTTLAATIAETEAQAEEAVKPSALAVDIKRATDLITGVSGGVIRFNYNGDGEPYELYILDTGDIATAQNVWRFNANGWGHSSTGWNGPFPLAATLDGGIVADFITAGTLTGLAINNGSGTFHVDSAGNVVANSLESSDATITGGKINISTAADSTDYITLNSTKASATMQTSGLYVTNKATAANPNRRASINGAALYLTETTGGKTLAQISGAGSGGYYRAGDSAGNTSGFFGYNAGNNGGGIVQLYNPAGTLIGEFGAFGNIGNVKLYNASGALTKSLAGMNTVDATTGTATTANATWLTVATLSHNAGKFLIVADVQFAANATGNRVIRLVTSGTTAISTAAECTCAGIATNYTHCKLCFVYDAATTGTWYLRAYQTSGGSLSVSASLWYIRLGETDT